jgi:hypothetical protein
MQATCATSSAPLVACNIAGIALMNCSIVKLVKKPIADCDFEHETAN